MSGPFVVQKPQVLLVATGQLSAAQMNTITSTVSLPLVPAPAVGLWNRVWEIQLTMLAGTSHVGWTIGGGANALLGYCASGGGVGAITTVVVAGTAGATSNKAITSPTDAKQPFPNAFYTTQTDSKSNNNQVTVLSISSAADGAPTAAAANPYSNASFCLGSGGSISNAANITLFYRIVYEQLPAATV